MVKIVVGTRRSQLALTQSKQFTDSLQAKFPELEIDCAVMPRGQYCTAESNFG